ncbi:heme lyase CcmF/NrfE family subunit, partial [bacterium]|nr:heme lyase CcmF/NrfE family subunit [bacterium]
MVEIGNLSQYAALGLTLGAIILLIWGIIRNDFRYIMGGRRAFAFTSLFTTLAAFSLTYLFATDAFQVEYVSSYSDRALPFFYKLTAFWAGQDGSLLFWVWTLSLFAAVVAFNTRNELDRRQTPYIYLVIAGCMAFFLFLLTRVTNPFDLLSFTPRDGQGL